MDTFDLSNRGSVTWLGNAVEVVRAGMERWPHALVAQLAEAADLKSAECRFESDRGHLYLLASEALDSVTM